MNNLAGQLETRTIPQWFMTQLFYSVNHSANVLHSRDDAMVDKDLPLADFRLIRMKYEFRVGGRYAASSIRIYGA